MTNRKFLPIALALLGGAASCHGETPDDAFRGFVAAILAHRQDDAWAHLSAASQAAMKAARDNAAALAPKGTVPDDPKALLFGEDVGLARPIDKIEVVSQSGSRARLSVEAGGEKHEVQMVREDGRWKLDLTYGLKL